MDTRFLEYFLRVAELGSMNKAATDLSLSQPALSRHIASLEQEMGTRLFTRGQGGVRLTESGKLLFDRLRPLLRQFSSLKEEVGTKAAGRLTIGTPPSWESIFTAPFVERLLTVQPAAKLRVYEGVSNVLRDYMYAGMLDLCISTFNASIPSGFTQTKLMCEPLVLIGNAKQALRSTESAPISILSGMSLILPSPPNLIRSVIERRLTHNDMSFNQVVEADTMPLCINLVRKGLGNTIVSAALLDNLRHDHSISWAPLKGLDITWSLLENEARLHSHMVREGRKAILETITAALSDSFWYGAEYLGPPRSSTYAD